MSDNDYGEGRGERVESRESRYGYSDMDISILGRPCVFHSRKHQRTTQVYINSQNANVFKELKGILAREKKSVSQFFFEHAQSYVRLHEPGNPQQRLDTILKLGKAYHAPSRVCGFKDCMRDSVAVGLFIPNKTEYGLCRKHYGESREKPSLWQILVKPEKKVK